MEHPKDILILTPVKDAVKHLDRYLELLSNLTYPKENISIGILEGDSSDDTHDYLSNLLPALNRTFKKVSLWKRDYSFEIPENLARYDSSIQLKRRSVLAKSRNYLLSKALQDQDWVLWLDVDLIEYPANIIEQLLSYNKEIIHPNAVRVYGGKSFDRNAWSNAGKLHLHDLKPTGKLVKLDSVGGTMLLVKSDLHREGLIFPPYLYGRKSPKIRSNNHLVGEVALIDKIRSLLNIQNQHQGEIETEGFGIMAGDMGYECWGLPHLEILHSME